MTRVIRPTGSSSTWKAKKVSKEPKSVEDYALGPVNKKTGQRPRKGEGGYLRMLMKMKQNQEALAAQEITEEDLLERAFEMARKQFAKQFDEPEVTEDNPDPFGDQEYRREQEERYRQEYEWDSLNANDEASLTDLLDLEVQSRILSRALNSQHLSVKDRTELLGERRNIAKDHATLQKALGMDRATRDTKARTGDPMQVLKEQIKSGAEMMQRLIDEAPKQFATAANEGELRILMKHHLGFPYAIVDATLREHRRVLGLSLQIQTEDTPVSDSPSAVVA